MRTAPRIVAPLVLASAMLASASCGGTPAHAPPAKVGRADADAAESPDPEPATDPKVSFSLHRVERPGFTTQQLAALFEIESGWHIYWQNPGDAGLPTKLELEGFPNARTQFPVPERFISPGDIESFGYGHTAALLLQVPARASGPLTVKARWLACRERCVNQSASVTIAPETQPDPRSPEWLAALAPSLPPDTVRASWSGDTLSLQPLGQGALISDFFPLQVEPMIFDEAKIQPDGSASLRWHRGGQGTALGAQGLLWIRDPKTAPDAPAQAYTLSLPWPPAAKP